nr:hypothetical protein [Morchella crassipes]
MTIHLSEFLNICINSQLNINFGLKVTALTNKKNIIILTFKLIMLIRIWTQNYLFIIYIFSYRSILNIISYVPDTYGTQILIIDKFYYLLLSRYRSDQVAIRS